MGEHGVLACAPGSFESSWGFLIVEQENRMTHSLAVVSGFSKHVHSQLPSKREGCAKCFYPRHFGDAFVSTLSDLPEKMHEALRNNYSLYAMTIAELDVTFSATHGQKGRDMLVDAIRDAGHRWGGIDKEYSKIRGTDARVFAEAWVKNIKYYGFKAEMIEASEKKAVVRIYHCPLMDIWAEAGVKMKPGICEVEPEFDTGTARFVNPQIGFRWHIGLPTGEPYCEYTFEMKG